MNGVNCDRLEPRLASDQSTASNRKSSACSLTQTNRCRKWLLRFRGNTFSCCSLPTTTPGEIETEVANRFIRASVIGLRLTNSYHRSGLIR